MDFDHTSGLLTSSVTDGTITVGGTAGLVIPTGTTAQRPASPSFGTLRINSTNSSLEYYNNSTWLTVGGGVTSVALTLPSIFSVTGSPITSAGTLTATLVSQAANTVLAGPTSGSGAPSFRTLALSTGAMSDVAVSGAPTNSILTYNGTQWVPSGSTSTAASGLLTTWTATGGNPVRYTANFSHNLGTFSVVVSLFDSTTNQMVIPDALRLVDANTVQVTVATNTRSLRIVVVANGLTVGVGNGAAAITVQNSGVSIGSTFTTINLTGDLTAVNSGGGIATITTPVSVANAGGSPSLQQDTLANRPAAGTAGRLFLATDTNVLYRDTGTTWVPLTNSAIRTLSYVAAALDSPNNSDWVVNALAPGIPDPSSNALTVRSFDGTTEQGVGFLITPPAAATAVTFTFKARPQTAPGATSIVQPRVYRRSFPNGSAPGAWGTAVELGNITIGTNANFTYTSQTVALSTLGWTPGQLTLVELTRRTTGLTGGTNLAGAWLLAELQLDFN